MESLFSGRSGFAEKQSGEGVEEGYASERQKVCVHRFFVAFQGNPAIMKITQVCVGVDTMSIVYTKLWRRIAEKGMKKKDLREAAGISRASIAKLGKNEIVTTEVLFKICSALNCDLSDIAEVETNDATSPECLTASMDNAIVYGVNSFFAGIGGFDIAFERHGFETRYLCEINDFCNDVLATHWPSVKKATDICSIDDANIPTAEVWCGGFPCQDISVARGAAKRLGLGGTRSGLFYRYAELIEKKKPPVVIIENVEGLFNSNGGRDFGVILQRMTSLGYAVAWRLLNSRYFGVPQSRPRIYLCCWLDSPYKALRVMFDDEGAYKPGNERKDFITEADGSTGFPKVPRVAYCLAATSGRHTGTDWSRTYVVEEKGVRRLTPKEYERLQGFPDGWTLPDTYNPETDDTDTLRYTAVGNAVSVPVVEWIARRVHEEMKATYGEVARSDIQAYVPEFFKSSWSHLHLSSINFTESSVSYKWPKAGIAWDNSFIGGNVPPAPHTPIQSLLIDVVEKAPVGVRYILTLNTKRGRRHTAPRGQ